MARSLVVRRLGFCVLLLVALGGCKASVNAEAKASTSSASASADGEAELSTTESGPEQAKDDLDEPLEQKRLTQAASAGLASSGPVLLGARRDLGYKGAKQAVCSCLAVELGQPDDPAFQWEKGPPRIEPSRQLVVALSSQGVACDAETGLGASYKGYLARGNDVIIMVEPAQKGIPVTSGAVIPRPIAGGQIFVVAEKGSPFGGAAGAPTEPCKLEMPPGSEGMLTTAASGVMNVEQEESASESQDESLPEQDSDDFMDVEDGQLGDERLPRSPETRDGFFLSLAPGGSYLMLDDRDADARFEGFGFGLDALIGGHPSEGLALGAILGGAAYPSPDLQVQGATLGSDFDLNMFHIGAFLSYYTDPASGLNLLAELGYIQFGASGTRVASLDIQGFAMAAGLGYDWWVSDSWSLGLLGRFTFAPMQHQQQDNGYWLFLPGLNFTATYH